MPPVNDTRAHQCSIWVQAFSGSPRIANSFVISCFATVRRSRSRREHLCIMAELKDNVNRICLKYSSKRDSCGTGNGVPGTRAPGLPGFGKLGWQHARLSRVGVEALLPVALPDPRSSASIRGKSIFCTQCRPSLSSVLIKPYRFPSSHTVPPTTRHPETGAKREHL
jgi:hypothetical protein